MPLAHYFKGLFGEFLNRAGHRLLLPRKRYHAFHNIVIPSRAGTTEIDHLIVSTFGIFVIETKYWSGWLYGTQWDKAWTRVHFRNKRQIPNPLHQNYGHVMALSELLGIPPERFSPLVAIRGATFKTHVPQGVVLGGYARHVRRALSPEIDDDELARILSVLRSDRVGRGWIARLRHAWFTKARPLPFAVIKPPKAAPLPPSCAPQQPVAENRAPRMATSAPPPSGSTASQAFCIGCGAHAHFDPARPMCLNCYRASRKGTNTAALPRRSCHRCGEPAAGTLSKPICRTCWPQLPKALQQSIVAALARG